MPGLIQDVERWRPIASAIVADRANNNPEETDRLNTADVTSQRLVDTLLALIQVESSGDPNARGDITADHPEGKSVGLLQLNYADGTPQNVGYTGTRENLFEPSENIRWGLALLVHNLARYNYVLDYAVISHRFGTAKIPPTAGQTYYWNDVLDLLASQEPGQWAGHDQSGLAGASGLILGAGIVYAIYKLARRFF